MARHEMRIFRDAAIGAAIAAGRLIKGSVGKVRRISYKGRINIVTDVDRKAERIIVRRLAAAFPSHSILSEESPLRRRPSAYRWVVDPLDGTTNFAHAFPFFAVSIALEKEGAAVLGVVYDPMRQELFVAERGRGAFLNRKRISVSRIARLSESFLATGFAYGIKEAKNDNIANFKKFLMRSLAIRRAGSAALDLSYVACGRFDGFWEMGLKPWDAAAGGLLVTEAGGRVSHFDGSDHSYYDPDILATNGAIHEKMTRLLS